jgi:hypothetical protein
LSHSGPQNYNIGVLICGRQFDSIHGMAKQENEQTAGRQGGEQMSEAEIDYNVMGSFPASDPPSWTLGVRPNKTSRELFEGEKPSPHDPSHLNEPVE